MSTTGCSRAVFRQVRDWWLRDVPSSYDAPVPMPVFMRWFKADPKVDEYCRESFGGAVEHARSLNTGQIEEMVTGPEEAVGAIILLDQMPRNIFRGEAAKTVYNDFDPKALSLAKTFLGQYDYGNRNLHSNFAQSLFLYLPLTHSENPADHEHLAKLFAARLALAESETERQGMDKFAQSEKEHYDVLKEYGRYPSRNAALGLESTEAELKYLADGGGFGAK